MNEKIDENRFTIIQFYFYDFTHVVSQQWQWLLTFL